jgi:hypothetical protein
MSYRVKQIISGLTIAICVFMMGIVVGMSNCNKPNNHVSDLDTKTILMIDDIKYFSVFYYEGRWEIRGEFKTNCGITPFKTGDQDSFQKAIVRVKELKACYTSCGSNK